MLIDFKNLKEIREKHKGQKIIFTGGFFDLLHLGHINYFKLLKSMGDVLVVSISSDKRAKEKKGEGRPIQNEKDRALIVEAVRYVDYVFILPYEYAQDNREMASVLFLEELRPDVAVYTHKKFLAYEDFAKKIGVKMEILELKEDKEHSTTSIIKKIQGLN